MQILHFFQTKFQIFTDTHFSTTNRRKVINAEKSPFLAHPVPCKDQ